MPHASDISKINPAKSWLKPAKTSTSTRQTFSASHIWTGGPTVRSGQVHRLPAARHAGVIIWG